MPAEDVAAQTTVSMVKGGVEVLITISRELLRLLAQHSGKAIRKDPLDRAINRHKVSESRLQWIADKTGTGVQTIDLEGMSKDDPRLREFDRVLKQMGVRYSLTAYNGVPALSLLVKDEQQVMAAAKRAGMCLGQQTVNKLDTQGERLARDAAKHAGINREAAKSTPVVTIGMRTQPFDLHGGILTQNLRRLGIPFVADDAGRSVRVSFRQGDAGAVKGLLDSLTGQKAVTHYGKDRIEDYARLEQAATQTEPVQAQDPALTQRLEQAERDTAPDLGEQEQAPAAQAHEEPAAAKTAPAAAEQSTYHKYFDEDRMPDKDKPMDFTPGQLGKAIDDGLKAKAASQAAGQVREQTQKIGEEAREIHHGR